MSNLILNIRFGSRHLQIARDRPHISFSVSPYHARGGDGRASPDWRWFQIH